MSNEIGNRDVAAILVAGGSSIRFGGQKQLELIGDLRMYQFVARTFSRVSSIGKIILVGRAEDVEGMEEGVKVLNLSINCQIVSGGASRQGSVENGLNALKGSPGIGIVLVHDVARPLVSDTIILSIIAAIREYGSAITAIEVVDTIKRAVNEEIVETVLRENLWRAQTPQGAKIELLRSAFAAARKTNFLATDEAQLLERVGERPRIVQGSDMNFKITYPGDLERARVALSDRN